MRQPGEPSIEEILDSIKRVIAGEDHGGRPAIAAPAAATRGAEPVEPAEMPEDDEDPAGEVLDLAVHDYRAAPAPVPAPPVPSPAPLPTPASPLVTDNASQAMRGSLDALANAAKAPPPPPAGGGAADALLRELLRPALSDWLDRNLPAIVERMVAAEIARIAGRPG